MPDKVKIDLNARDVAKVNAVFEKLDKNATNGLKRLIGETVVNIHRDTTQACPVKTGTLRSSYTMEVKETEGAMYTDIDYAPSVEYGTDRQRSQPHFEPAVEKHLPDFEKALEKLIDVK